MKHSTLIVLVLLVTDFLKSQNVKFGFHEVHSSPCISETKHSEIIEQLEKGKALLRQKGILPESNNLRSFPSFLWPVAVNPAFPQFQSCFSTGPHFDQNPTGDALLDYNCGVNTYDGHKGTDIGLWPFSWYQVDQNVAHVVAAAAGIIIGKEDGAYSYNCAWSPSNWNAVYIQHSDGTVAWYGHLKAGTLTSKQVGQSVLVGEYLGVAASSGVSTGPHLHFEVLTADNISVDPFDSQCNSTIGASLWQSQKPYYDPKVNAIFTHSAPPVFMNCGDPDITNFKNVFSPGERVYAAVYLREIQPSDALTFQILKPNGSTFFTTPVSINATYQNAYYYWYFDGSITDLGTWTVQAILNNENPVSGSFTVSQNAYPAVSVLGTAIPGTEWENDYLLTTGDGTNYYGYNVYMYQGECKFRQNTNWIVNWGQTGFPSGIGFNDGPNIPVSEFGYYNITFNRLSGAYNFSPGSFQRSVGILGNALNGWDVDEDMQTSDGILYSISGLPLGNGEVKFRMNDNWLCNWGSADFPAGTGTNNDVNIPVNGGLYDVTLDRYTGNYSFVPAVITNLSTAELPLLKTYPNPADESILLNCNTNETGRLRIMDLQGKLAIEHNAIQLNGGKSISLNTLKQGVYLIEFQTEQHRLTQRLVKL
jgi:hypothetical protein